MKKSSEARVEALSPPQPAGDVGPAPRAPSAPRIALVHDWLTGMRGGEKVLEALCEVYPDAEILTLIHVRGTVSPIISRHRIHASWLSRVPGVRHFYRACLPLFPSAIESFDTDAYDLVISTSHCAAKSIIATRGRHLCYCLTPMRYAWDQFDAYFGPDRLGPAGARLMRPLMARVARWDRATAGRPSRYVAISQYVARRIGRYYNRGASVVYPPVDTAFYTPDGAHPDRYFLIVSALVPYKRLDVAIQAAARARVRLRIAGRGPEEARLRKLAAETGGDVEFLGRVGDEDLRTLYRGAAGLAFPGEEDFGIVPVEAQACGRPVVALARGGALETVVDGVTGILVDDPSVDAFADGLNRAVAHTFDSSAIRSHAERFSRGRFQREIAAEVAKT
jgi:glycosyltransferase involved in cell wall biosynthesis